MSYAIPIIVLIQLLVGVYQANIQFAEPEKKGIVYQAPLEDIFELIGKHQWLSQRAQNGDAGSLNELKIVESKVDTLFTAVEKTQAEIGVDLQFTEEGLGKRQREHFQVATLNSLNSPFSRPSVET